MKEPKDAKNWLAALTRQAGDQLRGETFVAACPLATRGYIHRSAQAGAGSIPTTKLAQNVINGESMPRKMVFGLTTTRLFVFELTNAARAGDVKAIVPLSVIADVTSVKFKSFFVPRLNVDIAFRDSNRLLIEAGWPGVEKAERFVGALRSTIARRDS
jgi:hypothetical protein